MTSRSQWRSALALCAGWMVLTACERTEQPRKTGEARSAQAQTGRAPAPGEALQPGAGAMRGQMAPTANSACPTLDPGAATAQPIRRAVAMIEPHSGSKVTGKVVFEQQDRGVKMIADLAGLPPGKHAIHVHAFGDCSSNNAMSAGPHFSFRGSFEEEQHANHITGNLGNLTSEAGGKAHLEETIADATLAGRFTIIGRSVVVHAMENNPHKPPDGGAGMRIGCGVIGIERQ